MWTRLNEITTLIEDCPHSTAKDEGSGYPLIRTPNVGVGRLLLEGVHRVSKDVYDKRNIRAIPQEGDIIYAREAPAGNAATIQKGEIVCLGQRTVLIRPLKGFVYSLLLTYFINAPLSRKSLISKAVGSTAAHVNMEVIRPFWIPLPPLQEQIRIVKEVERLFTIINSIEIEQIELENKISMMKSRVLELAISGKLVPQDPADEPADELLLRINPSAKAADKSHYGQLPNGWSYTTMNFICQLYDGEKIENKELINLDAKYLRGKSEGNILNKGRFTPEKTTMILVDGENSGEIFTAPIDGYQGSTFKLLDICEEMNAEYVKMIIRIYQKRLRDNKVGSAIPHLNKKMFREILVPVPPIAEQIRIVRRTYELMSKIAELTEVL